MIHVGKCNLCKGRVVMPLPDGFNPNLKSLHGFRTPMDLRCINCGAKPSGEPLLEMVEPPRAFAQARQ